MRNSEYFVPNASHVGVEPEPNVTAVCSLSMCPMFASRKFNSYKCPLFSKNKVLVLENSRNQWHNNGTPVVFASKKNCDGYSFVKNENKGSRSSKDLLQSNEIDLSVKSFQDASTYMDRPPEAETTNAYFAEHPILDCIGSSCGLGALIITLWCIFDWYVWFMELWRRCVAKES